MIESSKSEVQTAQLFQQHISGSERYLFDIYTNENPDAREAVGITDGIAAVDGTGPKQARRKRHREWRFPFELIQKALETRHDSTRRLVDSLAVWDSLGRQSQAMNELPIDLDYPGFQRSTALLLLVKSYMPKVGLVGFTMTATKSTCNYWHNWL